MKSTPEIINISSDSSSDEQWDSTPLPTYIPPFRPPRNRCRSKEQARKRIHDLPVFKDLLNLNQTPSTSRGKAVMSPKSPSSSESSEDPNPWISIQPPPRELVSPFICTSSDEDEPQRNPPSTPERPQSSRPRPPTRFVQFSLAQKGVSASTPSNIQTHSSKKRKSNPPLPKSREIVLGLPCPRR
jgi:hypothetical protein